MSNKIPMFRIGLDIGSTTIKMVVLNVDNKVVEERYERHNMKIGEMSIAYLEDLAGKIGADVSVSLSITGSIGLGIAERCVLPFVQEVAAAAKAAYFRYPGVSTMIDIGGEDAKIVFFQDGEVRDFRMNGACAGGTGAFIDQMALLLGVDTGELSDMALLADQIHPIASRCGVFCKTDVQNLLARKVSRENIAASIFHAVAVQTVTTLAHGQDILAPVLFCGGPLTYLPALRKAFMDYLSLDVSRVIYSDKGYLLPALGTALSIDAANESMSLKELIDRMRRGLEAKRLRGDTLKPLFANDADYKEWTIRMNRYKVPRGKLRTGIMEAYLGIDSGSTTTKIVLLDDQERLIYSYYVSNNGDAVGAVEKGLMELRSACVEAGTQLRIKGSCSTGYGEDLIKAAFRLGHGIVETIAHFLAARNQDKSVSFILDIGGQDMKAIFVDGGIINRVEINEACSSGCGSFIETFSRSLGYSPHDFSLAACHSEAPCDLGTRCTVFMNSKVKQVLREGATIEDVSAGLSYSVVKNCLYKVLKLKNVSVLGTHVTVQGGTMRNDAVVRAFEELTGINVIRNDIPELMGAFGCALYAKRYPLEEPVGLDLMLDKTDMVSSESRCKGCENHCLVTRVKMGDGRSYYSGNRCERIFSNSGVKRKPGKNVYCRKNELLFDREVAVGQPLMTVGIPRCLNMYEEYPFWHTLLTACGIQVRLSDPSRSQEYESCARMVMSDNICFPAKLAHAHIENLKQKGVDRIFMPFVVHERMDGGQNSYNCPVVTGYSEVIKSVQGEGIPIDSPVISFKDSRLLFEQCESILSGWQVSERTIAHAFKEAMAAWDRYREELKALNESVWREAKEQDDWVVLLAGRPYHTDPLIQHGVAELIASMGIDVLSEDIVRGESVKDNDAYFVSQWTFPNRILKAAEWCAGQDQKILFMEMTSFGCGPDAFMLDEVRDLLARHGRSFTLLKLDDVNNLGSIKLRIRSAIESCRLSLMEKPTEKPVAPLVSSPIYKREDRRRKIIIPYFTPYVSPLLPSIVRLAGYEADCLPMSDQYSCDYGLRYANNEVCYPATLVVGDVIKAFKSGLYDPASTAVAITQTGGQCRASNYISLIRRALSEAGYTGVPVVSISFDSGITNDQPGFRVNWLRILPIALYLVLYSDCIAKFFSAAVVRESETGAAGRLRDHYLTLGAEAIERYDIDRLLELLKQAALDFNGICTDRSPKASVGIVGEIYLKFNPFSHKNIENWLIDHQIEVVTPVLLDFFTQNFVNRRENKRVRLLKDHRPDFMYDWAYKLIRKQIDKVNRIGSTFRYFRPFGDIFEEAESVRNVVSLNAQFGEGWLLPAEVLSYLRSGVNNVISMQPFGCIANHIVAKGIERRLKELYPRLNLLSLDFDGGVSEVNIINRLLLFIDQCAGVGRKC